MSLDEKQLFPRPGGAEKSAPETPGAQAARPLLTKGVKP